MTEIQEKMLVDATKTDPVYRNLFHQCQNLEKAYLRIRDSLPDEDQEVLDRYISICEEMEYRGTCLAADLFSQ